MTPTRKCVLVVDDDPNNLRILALDLEREFEVITARDGVEALEVISAESHAFSAVLLDRMMPRMNGMEFLECLKADRRWKHLPVIMQTAAAAKAQVIEGVEAGVFYYLTKPYEKDVMLALVRAAVGDHDRYCRLASDLAEVQLGASLVRECSLEARTLEEIEALSVFIARLYPDPSAVVFGIEEFLLNALEHGNLGISYEEKTRLNQVFDWRGEVLRRQELAENAHKRVRIVYQDREDRRILRIRDEGPGFDWREYLEISPKRAMDNHGRGIALSRLTSFDEVEFLGRGNEVVCSVLKVG